MIGRVALMVSILMLAVAGLSAAADLDGGVIEGQVVNGTSGGSIVADQNVSLTVYLGDTEAGSLDTEADAEGRFRFEGLATGPDYSYQVTIAYQEAEYASEWLTFTEDEPSRSIELLVYDATSSDEAIQVMMSHAIVYVEGESLLVKEYLLFANTADRTYVGSKEETVAGKKGTLRFSLPEDANELQLSLGLMDCCTVRTKAGLVDTIPIAPGMKEMAYSYRVKYSPGSTSLSEVIHYPTAGFDLLVQSETIKASSDKMTVAEPLDIQGVRFAHLSATDIAPGTVLEIRLSDPPKSGTQDTLRWAALALILLVGGFGLGYPLIRKRRQPAVSEDGLNQRRQRLISDIAQLDDDFESHRISEEDYLKMRSERKEQLVELMRRIRDDR